MNQKGIVSFFFPAFLVLFVYTAYLNKYLGYLYTGIPCVLGILVLAMGSGELKKMSFPLKVAIAFNIWMLCSYMYAIYPATTLKTWVSFVTCFILDMFLYLYGMDKDFICVIEKLNKWSVLFCAVTVFSILFPSLYKAFIIPMLPAEIKVNALRFINDGGFASSGLTNQTGINAWFCVLGISTSWCSILAGKKNKRYYAVFLLSLLAVFFTAKRAHLLFSAAAAGILFLHVNKKNPAKIVVIVFAMIALVVLMYVVFPAVFGHWIDRFDSSDGGDISSGRFLLWGMAWYLFLQKPVTGWGWGYFSFLKVLRDTPMNVHNVYLQVLCELGIVGEVLFVLMLFTNLIRALKTLHLIETYKTEYMYAAMFCVFIQIFIILYCFTGNPFNDRFELIIYFFTIFLTERLNKLCIDANLIPVRNQKHYFWRQNVHP